MYCIKCGVKLPDNALFCCQCGKEIEYKQVSVNVNKNLDLIMESIVQTDFFNEDSSCYLRGNLPREELTNAMEEYGRELEVNQDDIWLLCDDTCFADAGKCGFLIDSRGIVTSRKIRINFDELLAIRLDDSEIIVRIKSNGFGKQEEAIYSVDSLDDEDEARLKELFETITDDVILQE